jgi:hypothetical protein
MPPASRAQAHNGTVPLAIVRRPLPAFFLTFRAGDQAADPDPRTPDRPPCCIQSRR